MRDSLKERLSNNEYDRRLYIASDESDNRVKSDVYAQVGVGIAAFKSVLEDATQWCNILMLSVYTKHCQASTDAANATVISVFVGDKDYQSLEGAQVLNFKVTLVNSSDQYFDVILSAPRGPYGTSNYQMRVEGIRQGENETFVHLAYACDYSVLSKIALDAYLATMGAGKVGFTKTMASGKGLERYIGGPRGVLERNAMRYFLAVEAFVLAIRLPPDQQQEAWLNGWFSQAQRYPRQLHDFDLAAYMQVKRREYRRMQDLSR